MKIFFTLDYELFFGKQTGTSENCILNPTNRLIEICDRTGALLTFFIDSGYLLKLKEYSAEHPELKKEYDQVSGQIKSLVEKGHDCQLHIHPHWEDSIYKDGKWEIDASRYKLVDFEEEDIERIVLTYQAELKSITGKEINIYRAGGWCLQPFEKVRKAFLKAGIKLDSTVFKGGYFDKGGYFYDFKNCPDKFKWRFDADLCEDKPEGAFLEMPIGNMEIGPLFFWRLFGMGRLDPKNHKPMGDGYPIPSPGLRKKYLTQRNNHAVSMDGFFVNLLPKAVKKYKRLGADELVVIGHPKACTEYSLRKLEKFITSNKDKLKFEPLSALL